MRRPATAWYWSARRRRPGDSTGRPSSVKPAAPRPASSTISVSSAPSWPLLIAARKPTGTPASIPARSTSAPSTAEDGRPHDETAPNLPLDERVRRVGHRGVDLDAAVHGARMHDPLARPEPLRRDTPASGVLAQAGYVVRAFEHALTLHAQDVDDV